MALSEEDQDKVTVVMVALRKEASASGYGSFITEDQIRKTAIAVLTALKELKSGTTI